MIRKAEAMWELGRLKEAVGSLQGGDKAVTEKQEEMKKLYEKSYGLPYGHPTMDKIERFVRWMEENGAKFNKIRMRYYGPDYRGVHTTEAIQPSELFLSVPHKLIITPQKGRETPMGMKIVKSGVKVNWDYLLYITLFLMTEFHKPDSWWKPYLDVYPHSVDSFPMFYTPAERKLLMGSPMWEQIDDEIKEIKYEYDAIVAAVPEFKQFSLDEYMKNKTLVISRIFFVTIHGKVDRIMVPLADMFNHHYERLGETVWRYNDRDEAFNVNAQKLIKVGDPVPIRNGDERG